MKRILIKMLGFPSQIFNRIQIKRHRVVHGENFRINGKIYFHGYGKYLFGHDVFINSAPKSNSSAGGTNCNFTVKNGAELRIGSNVGISHLQLTVWSQVVIEDDVLIGSNCMISDTDFHSLDAEDRRNERINGQVNVRVKPITIKKGAFIGGRCIILKGVTIGENSIVGAGSVVTKSIPDNEVWAGNPACFIKKL